MLVSERQQRIFRIAVEGHIASGEPISSEWVTSQLPDKVSSATVRAELMELERAGLVRQPHTSAGRVPTETGYRYYIDHFVHGNDEAHASEVEHEMDIVEEHFDSAASPEEKLRGIARELSQIAGNVVMIGTDPRSLYAVGMGRMFQAPEAQDVEIMQHISLALDHADDLLEELYKLASGPVGEIRVLIGKQNPFDESCSLIVTKAATSEGEKLMALLGFMRMRYDRNIALMQAMKRLLENEL